MYFKTKVGLDMLLDSLEEQDNIYLSNEEENLTISEYLEQYRLTQDEDNVSD